MSEPKKKPGRPKKPKETAQIEHKGVVGTPTCDGDILEIVYSNPMLFRRVLALYKAYGVSEIELRFSRAGITIESGAHLKNTCIYTDIRGANMNLYYCEQDVSIFMNRGHLENVLNTLTKTCSQITFVLKKQNFRSILYVVIRDPGAEIDYSFDIDVAYKETGGAPTTHYSDGDYPLRFQLSSKDFKQQISNMKKLSSVWMLQKNGAIGPLQLAFEHQHNGISAFSAVFLSPEKIALQSTLTDADILNVSVPIDAILPFSNSALADDVLIAADYERRISFTAMLDKSSLPDTDPYACVVRVFTEQNHLAA